MDLIEQIFGVDLSRFGDVTIYFAMGAIATLVFVIRLVMALFLGADGGDFDVEVDASGDAGTDTSFSLFSLLSITAFFMGTGWMGFACRNDWQLNGPVSLLISVVFGVFMMLLASGLMFFIRRLGSHGRFDAKLAKGTTGRVYLRIPQRGQGRGQVEVTADGRRRILDAVSTGDAIESFRSVRIIQVLDDDSLVVEADAPPAPPSTTE